ncbi:MAG: hypothetical protein CVU71_00985 [Deltaproteobacteria bacterium HGW-Deltaproteobacteria-6]|nr:MAG: hypothetical protein CVU71_00985 [Deltaproteobacteria bacterium HGW-Deltaproteobacteria-6]
MSLINCPACNSKVSSKAVSCPHCGHPLQDIMSKSSKNRSTAIILSLLLGGAGVHKFYLDKPGSGLLYLLFCWTFIPAICGLIEAFQYAKMSDDVFQKKYLAKEL